MIILFLNNMTLIVSFVFLISKLLRNGDKVKKSTYISFFISLLSGLLSMLLMTSHFTLAFNGMFFDLRHIPIFFVTYLLGWKAGIISALFPSAYRLYLGGPGWQSVIISTIIPWTVATLFRAKKEPLVFDEQFNLIKVYMIYLVEVISKSIAMWFLLPLSVKMWALISLNILTFSSIALIVMVLMTNDFINSVNYQEHLKKNKERYNTLFQLLPIAVFVHDKKKIAFSNTAGLNLAGIDDINSIIDRNIDEILTFLPSEEDSPIEENIMNTIPGYTECKIKNHAGMIIDVEINELPYEFEDTSYNLLMIHDITERKKMEILREKMEKEKQLLKEAAEYDLLRTEFFSNISHELRTPLNLIFSTTQLIDVKWRKTHPGNLDQFVKILKQNSYRMLKLINNLIDITKLDSRYFVIEKYKCNIVNIIEEITLSVTYWMANKNIRLIFDTDVEERIIAVDPNAIERIILNLLSNAAKFTQEEGVVTVNIIDGSEYITIVVEDTGQGIPAEKIDIIFDRFRQVDKSFTRNHEGSGIGLSLVKNLVELHHGDIRVKSELGKGTQFIICLPNNILDYNSKEDNYHLDKLNDNLIERINIEFSDIYS